MCLRIILEGKKSMYQLAESVFVNSPQAAASVQGGGGGGKKKCDTSCFQKEKKTKQGKKNDELPAPDIFTMIGKGPSKKKSAEKHSGESTRDQRGKNVPRKPGKKQSRSWEKEKGKRPEDATFNRPPTKSTKRGETRSLPSKGKKWRGSSEKGGFFSYGLLFVNNAFRRRRNQGWY